MPIISRPTRPSDWEDPDLWDVDEQCVQRALEQMRKRFIEERVQGFTHPANQQTYPPVSQQEAEERWERVAERMNEMVRSYDRRTADKLGTHTFNAQRARSKHAEMDEPSLRRGESMVSYICGKSIQS